MGILGGALSAIGKLATGSMEASMEVAKPIATASTVAVENTASIATAATEAGTIGTTITAEAATIGEIAPSVSKITEIINEFSLPSAPTPSTEAMPALSSFSMLPTESTMPTSGSKLEPAHGSTQTQIPSEQSSQIENPQEADTKNSTDEKNQQKQTESSEEEKTDEKKEQPDEKKPEDQKKAEEERAEQEAQQLMMQITEAYMRKKNAEVQAQQINDQIVQGNNTNEGQLTQLHITIGVATIQIGNCEKRLLQVIGTLPAIKQIMYKSSIAMMKMEGFESLN